MAKTKQAPSLSAEDFVPDSFLIRTSDPHGRSHGGFEWPRQVGAAVGCPDWNLKPVCGGGLHGLPDAGSRGDWSLLSDEPSALWWIVGYLKAEAVAIDDDKIKVPRGKVVYFGNMAGAFALAQREWRKNSSGDASTTGGGAHASTTGDRAIAVAIGRGNTAVAHAGGAIMLAAYDDDRKLVAVFSSLVGQNGIEPGVTYRLLTSGRVKVVE